MRCKYLARKEAGDFNDGQSKDSHDSVGWRRFTVIGWCSQGLSKKSWGHFSPLLKSSCQAGRYSSLLARSFFYSGQCRRNLANSFGGFCFSWSGMILPLYIPHLPADQPQYKGTSLQGLTCSTWLELVFPVLRLGFLILWSDMTSYLHHGDLTPVLVRGVSFSIFLNSSPHCWSHELPTWENSLIYSVLLPGFCKTKCPSYIMKRK